MVHGESTRVIFCDSRTGVKERGQLRRVVLVLMQSLISFFVTRLAPSFSVILQGCLYATPGHASRTRSGTPANGLQQVSFRRQSHEIPRTTEISRPSQAHLWQNIPLARAYHRTQGPRLHPMARSPHVPQPFPLHDARLQAMPVPIKVYRQVVP